MGKENKRKEKEEEKKREKKRKKKKENEENEERKENEEKQKGDEGEPCVEERRKKKGTTLPFTIFDEPVVETHWHKRQSWSMRQELRMGTRNCRFRRVPKSRGFSYTSYFLPSGHVRVILVQF